MEAMLPPLSPLSVVKVPLLRERPKQRQRVAANQQEMFHTLLSRRRKKYLARVRHHSISEEEKREPEKISYDLIPPSLYSDESSIKSNPQCTMIRLRNHLVVHKLITSIFHTFNNIHIDMIGGFH